MMSEKERLEIMLEETPGEGELQEIWDLLMAYEEKEPNDLDLFGYRMAYHILCGEYEKAVAVGEEAVQTNRNNVELRYHYAYALLLSEDWMRAYEQYCMTQVVQEELGVSVVPDEVLEAEIIEAREGARKQLEAEPEQEKAWEMLEWNIDNHFSMLLNPFQDDRDVIGKFYCDPSGTEYYLGCSDDWCHAYYKYVQGMSAITCKCEMYPFDYKGREYRLLPDRRLLLPLVPISSRESGRVDLTFTVDGKDYVVYCVAHEKYIYFPIEPGEVTVRSTADMVVGKPIPLQSDRRELVLNVFIDSFNWRFLTGIDGEEGRTLQALMPNTWSFFRAGAICTNAYSGSEWTYPSIATYMSGLHANRHLMVDGRLQMPLPAKVRVLTEYFKEAGFVTGKYGGNWRVTPNYGYMRGFDRGCYMYATQDYGVWEVVRDVIDHLETFQDTRQYVWMEMMDLHEIAGDFQRSISVESKVPVPYRQLDNNGGNTVRQGYSVNKQYLYEQELRRIDRALGTLYRYILEHYEENQITIALFSDHGTSFNVPNEEPMLSRKRVNVPMMFRGGRVPQGLCDEVIESCDYKHIMCRLADVPMEEPDGWMKSEGRLPVYFGGTERRRHAFAESIFQNEPYRAALHSAEYSFFLQSEEPIRYDSRVDLTGYETSLIDVDGNPLEDEELLRECTEEVFARMGYLRIRR